MTHDRRCPRFDHAENHEDTYWCSDRCDTAECLCDLIAEVRAETLEKAGQRLALARLTYGDSAGISEQGEQMLDVMRDAILRGES